MTKEEIIENISKETGKKSSEIKEIVDLLFSEITKSLEKGESITFNKFGRFETDIQKSKKVKVPKIKKIVKVPEKTVPKFRPSKILKNKVS